MMFSLLKEKKIPNGLITKESVFSFLCPQIAISNKLLTKLELALPVVSICRSLGLVHYVILFSF